MSLYRKQPVWGKKQKSTLNRIKSILEGPIIKGVKLIYNKEEKLQKTKPHNRIDYERQFSENRKNKEWKKNW